MSKHTNEFYDNIELVPDDSGENNHVVPEQTHFFDVKPEHHHHSSSGKESDRKHSRSYSNKKSSDTKNVKKKKTSTHKKKKKSLAFKIIIGILIFILCVIIGLAIAFVIMRNSGKEALLNYNNLNIDVPNGADSTDGGRTIYYNGHTYNFNTSIATILFMGIDNTSLKNNAVSGTAGQADALYLFTYDTNSGAIKVLSLNRDTMTDISRYDENGTYYDSSTSQLCLAYAYGDGKEVSATNQVTAVSRLLYNVPISAYYAIDLSAIRLLNDEIGGVTLTPNYTFGRFSKGVSLKITGDMAEEFVRYRDISQVDDNLRRMACQRQYITSFASQTVIAIKSDLSLPLSLYNDTKNYTVTDINASDITYLASSMAFNYSGLNIINTSGKYKMVKNDSSAEFKVNKKKLFETVLDLFYIKVK